MAAFRKLQLLRNSHQFLGRKDLLILSGFVSCQPSKVHSSRRSFSVKANLPPLPVPLLNSTFEKYLQHVELLLSPGEFQYTQNLVDRFLNTSGPKLQELLVERGKKMENWMADWWLNAAYLDFRVPVVVNVNPGCRFVREHFRSDDEWLSHASRFVSGVLGYKKIIDEDRLPTDMMGKHPLCMNQYRLIFNTCRIPGEKHDELVHFSKSSGGEQPRHICVMHNNRIFVVDVLDEAGNALNTSQILNQLKLVVSQSETKGPPIGLMTSEHRDVWGKTYKRMCTDPKNVESFSAIHKSLFFLCLDHPVFDGVPDEVNEIDTCTAKNVLHGGGHKMNSANRWFDKTVQFIFTRDGACGFNYEHAPAEGPPLMSLIDHTIRYMKNGAADSVSDGVGAGIQPPKELKFNIDSQTKSDLDVAKAKLWDLVNDLSLTIDAFDGFGKDYIKNQRLSPDAFTQIAFQLAYYRVYGEPCATYESGSTRMFSLGRTDTIRSCGPMSVAFTRTMADNNSDLAKRKDALRDAVTAHSRYTADVSTGQGIDRHLLGLKLIALENGLEVPELYNDIGFQRALHFKLSTSQVTAKEDAVLCYGPVVPDGIGLCYNPRRNRVRLAVSTFNSCPDSDAYQMADEVKKAFSDMRSVLDK